MNVLGIDEAGRGSVIGPLVIAGVMIKDNEEKKIEGVKDSKLLPHKKRIELSEKIIRNCSFKIIEISPREIDEALGSKSLNLNWLEAHKQAEIINELKPDIAVIDCPSPNIFKYTNYLRNLLDNKGIKLIVEHKADVNYPVCSAASILAKVRREERVAEIKKVYGDIGPGYPANPITKKFVEENWQRHPEIFRRSWTTFKKYSGGNNQSNLGEF